MDDDALALSPTLLLSRARSDQVNKSSRAPQQYIIRHTKVEICVDKQEEFSRKSAFFSTILDDYFSFLQQPVEYSRVDDEFCVRILFTTIRI